MIKLHFFTKTRIMNTSSERLKKIYSLSFSANSAFGLSWDQTDCKSGMIAIQEYVTKIAADVLSDTGSIIGNDWKAIWGPIVYVKDSTSISVHADNTMGMYYSPKENLIVIAIAGTNINSPFGWFTEDFSVSKTVPWESITGVSDSGNIAHGTSVGLKILLNMKDSKGTTIISALQAFLIANPTLKNIDIAVAGHSLGGALSPTLALYLLNKKSSWDSQEIANIGAFPTAGPTPGDEDFAKYYEDQINSNNITYLSQHNSIDVVPHAWQKEDLADIPTIYKDNIVPPSSANPNETITGALASGLALNALAAKNFLGVPVNRYQQIKPSTVLSGTFNTTTDDSVTKKLKHIGLVLPYGLIKYAPYLRNFIRFAAQAGTQHTTAYNSLLDIETFMTAYKEILANNKPKNHVTLETYEYAVKEITKVDLSKLDAKAMALALAKK